MFVADNQKDISKNMSNDIDEMEQLGIYECDEEDVALCSFVCPSKSDVGAIIRKGLDTIYFDK